MASKSVAVLDFGSSKISVLAGNPTVNNNYNIYAMGESDYAGFIDGEFLEPNKLKNCISNAIDNAMLNLNKKFDKLYIGVPAEFCYNIQKELSITFNKRLKIKQKHIDTLFGQVDDLELSDSHTIINKSPIVYELDTGEKSYNPIGSFTQKLKVLASFILVENKFLLLLNQIFKELGFSDFEFLSTSLTESLYLLDENIRESASILVDCGYITTSVMLCMNEGLLDLKSFSMGGGHITADLSEILKLPFNCSEQLKRKIILTMKCSDYDYYEIKINDELVKIGAKNVNDIALSRIDLIADIINKCLKEFKFDIPENAPIYLTGGGLCFMKGIKDYLGKVLDRKIIITTPKPLAYNKPDMSSALSLLDTAISIENY